MDTIYNLEIHNNFVSLCAESTNTSSTRIELVATNKTQPFIKWAGGKRWLTKTLSKLQPENWKGTYYEPFLGGGSVFFSLEPKNAVISDINKELITTYKTVRDEPEKIINLLKTYPHNKEFYYYLRAKTPYKPHTIAARLIYLNHTCWNGLYRVNSKGNFNTPYGQYKNPTICDEDRIRKASKVLKSADIADGYFENIINNAQRGDWVYLDPPYITGHQNNGFLEYNKSLFSWGDQEKLSKSAIKLSKSKVNVLVSNADYPKVVALYKGFYYYKVTRKSLIGGLVSSRGLVTEAILSNYPLFGIEGKIIK